MIVEATFYNIRCDLCGADSDEMWYNDKHNAETNAFDNADFKFLGGKHYCPSCYTIDDNDNIVTKDGRVFDYETEEELEGGEQ